MIKCYKRTNEQTKEQMDIAISRIAFATENQNFYDHPKKPKNTF